MTLSSRAIEETPEQIACRIVDKLSFSSNRMLNGRLVGEQYFAAIAIAEAIRAERERLQPPGFVLMPEQPTPAIVRGYISADRRRKRYASTAKRDYRAMLSAHQADEDSEGKNG